MQALSAELAKHRQELHALRQDVQAQCQEMRQHSVDVIIQSHVEKAMAGASMRWESLFRDLEESVHNLVNKETVSRSVEIQEAFAYFDAALKEAISGAMEADREAYKQSLAETHAAMVAHGTYVVSRLEELALPMDRRQHSEEKSQGGVRALSCALRAARAHAPAGVAMLDSIEEECAPQIEDCLASAEKYSSPTLSSASTGDQRAEDSEDLGVTQAVMETQFQCKDTSMASRLPICLGNGCAERGGRAYRISWLTDLVKGAAGPAQCAPNAPSPESIREPFSHCT